MQEPIHITSGDMAGKSLAEAGLPGEVFVWHDILYDGPREPGWPDENILSARALFLEEFTAGGLEQAYILETFHCQYRKLSEAAPQAQIVLWFDACLFDQAMLAHILMCLDCRKLRNVDLLCIDAFPGIEPFHGIGQLPPEAFASLYGQRRPVTDEQFRFAALVDAAFAAQDTLQLEKLSKETDAPLPGVPAAAMRWLQEQPDRISGLGRLETLALEAIRSGCETPGRIYQAVSAADTPPQYWGDTTLWTTINSLADHTPPIVKIEGPADKLPQWESRIPLDTFRITAVPDQEKRNRT